MNISDISHHHNHIIQFLSAGGIVEVKKLFIVPSISLKIFRKLKNVYSLFLKGIIVSNWSITVFVTDDFVSGALPNSKLNTPSLRANDVTDVSAEFVADPFIIQQDASFYMFFEVLNKASGRGEIGLASSSDGSEWNYKRLVLRENYHLSYPQVFAYQDEYYMLPETAEANGVLLYKARNFPYDWEVECELFSGRYLDPSIVNVNGTWWIFAGTDEGNLHLFYSDHLKGSWREHPQSPLLSNNMMISRPGGRLVVANGSVYRYTQADYPHYGDSVRIFKVNKLSEFEYEEEEVSCILSGSHIENDWRKDGMHHIDQLQMNDNQWLVAVDGHSLKNVNYLLWKLDRMKSKYFR
ncbi:glucosamine inositolphosphorylceramide transferase family protein [Paenibacillus andongensis]|uniref:glucosamine inositolphosphorylceramide transferase family protein n=1 Tax=Paenibacillus andongensis TaxID=2975482 RepID=UPI0021BB334B|nr:hypothetical protein [Paenibacillus andongensis]